MDILIVSQYLRDIENFEGNNSRFVYLAKLLAQNGNNQVEIVTSDFNHATKKNFQSVGKLQNVAVTAVHEPGYPKNVCLKRFSSHKKLANNIKKYLTNRKKPDICYCAVPSLSVADVVSKYCKKNNIKFIVDVQDLWPEAFKMVFHVPIISNIIFAPMKRQADRIYASADQIVAVSKTYGDRAQSVNRRSRKTVVVYLGTDKKVFEGYADKKLEELDNNDTIASVLHITLEKEVAVASNDCAELLENGIVRIAYCGTLGHSYDISCVINAIKLLDKSHRDRIEFIVMGDGPRKHEFMSDAKGLPIIFTGKLSYPDMVWMLRRCDISVNPITKGAAQSIINKHMDYAMAGLPVVNTQECIEYRNLLDKYRAGINCECENAEEVARALKSLIDDRKLRDLMGKNSLKMGAECFDRGITYNRLVELFQ